jgi:hypothetical protein
MTAPVSRPYSQHEQHGHLGRLWWLPADGEGYQLWVGASAYGEAEEVLVAVMPRLSREAARHADSTWR